MDAFQIFGLQTTLSLIVYTLIAKWYVWPRLTALPLHEALVPLLFVHTLRHVGMTVLVAGVVDPDVPQSFTVPLAYGDLVAALLALFSIFALRGRWSLVLPLVWVFNIWGFVDLLNAAYQGIRIDATRYDLGAGWFIPTFFVPALYVTHVMIFMLLLKRSH
ncbi:MAG: hypothetical protein L0287_19390 [Anaerolineae bacterium]|nr:hypothetical protein [Anaerolineae bacterium]MCI0610906.1 hypothetical protein [Anaerolineae bacterium]